MPETRDLNSELQGLLGYANQFAGANYSTQAGVNPSLTALNTNNWTQAILGNVDTEAFLTQHPEFRDGYNAAGANGAQWLNQAISSSGYINPASVPRTGGAAQIGSAAYNAANPGLASYTSGLQGAMDKLNQSAPGRVDPSGYFAATSAPAAANPTSMASYSGARATTGNGGPLLNPLQRDAAANLGQVSPIQSKLQSQAMSLLNANGGLTQAELQGAQDSARAAYSDRGLVRSNAGIGAEILQTDAAQRNRMLENANFAAGIDASGQQQLGANRGYAMGVQGQGQNLSLANSGLLTNTSTFNAGQRNNLAQFNASANNQNNQFGASLLQQNNQYNAGQQNQAGQFNASATNDMGRFNASQQAQNNNDAWSRAMQYGGLQLSQAQDPYRLASSMVGTAPDYTNSILQYGNGVNDYNANAINAAKISDANNRAATTSSWLSTAGKVVGAAASVKVVMACVPEGVRIDTPHGGVAIENLRAGMRVVGYDGFPVFVVMKHEYMEDHTQRRFVCLEFDGSNHSLTVCDKHKVEGRPSAEWEVGDVVGGRRIKAKTWHGGVRRSYDILTSDAGYRVSGVPVNSMIEEMAVATAKQREELKHAV